MNLVPHGGVRRAQRHVGGSYSQKEDYRRDTRSSRMKLSENHRSQHCQSLKNKTQVQGSSRRFQGAA